MFRYLGVCVRCTVAEEELKLFFKVDSLVLRVAKSRAMEFKSKP